MTCKQCGIELEEGHLFCSACGAQQDPIEEAPIAEEPVAEELIAEEPIVEEPTAEEPIVEEPTAEEPIVEEPAAEEPVVEEVSAPCCPQCGTLLEEGSVFCSECGTQCPAPEAAEPIPTCAKCGTPLREGYTFCGRCGAPVSDAPTPEQPAPVIAPQPAPQPEAVQPPKKLRKGPPLGVRILLRLLSLLLCIALIGTVLTTAIVMDLRQLTSQENLEQLIDTLITADTSPTSTPWALSNNAPAPAPSSSSILDSLVEWVYEYLDENIEEDLNITLEQMQEFVDRSSAKDILAEKAAGYIEDFIMGTDNTDITPNEILDVIEDNRALVEEVFGEYNVTVDVDAIKETMTDFLEKNDLNETIRVEVFEKLEEEPIMGENLKVKDLLEQFRFLTSDTVLVMLIAANLFLILLLFFTNWLRLSATLGWAGTTVTMVGCMLAVPVILLQVMPNVIGDLFSASLGSAQADLISNTIGTLVSAIAPVHYTILGIGLAMLIASIVLKICRKRSAK